MTHFVVGPVPDEGVVVAAVGCAGVDGDANQLVLEVPGGRAAADGPVAHVLLVSRDEVVLHVGGHVEPEREGEVRVDLLFEHGQHVEGVPKG